MAAVAVALPGESLEAAEARREESVMREVDAEVRTVDEEVRRKDARVRKEDVALQEENLLLKLALERLANQTAPGNATRANSTQGNSTQGNSTQAGGPPVEDAGLSMDTIISIVCCCGIAAVVFAGSEWCMRSTSKVARKFRSAWERSSIGVMSLTTFRNLLLLLCFAVGGFVFLWKKGILQTYMSQMLCLVYVLAVVISILLIFVREAMKDLQGPIKEIMDTVKKLQGVFDGGVNDVPANSTSAWLGGAMRGLSGAPSSSTRRGRR